MEALEDKRVRLQPECKKRLNDRIEMWSYAAKVKTKRASDMAASSASFISVAYVIGVILATN